MAKKNDTFQTETAVYAVHTEDGVVSVEATSAGEAIELAGAQGSVAETEEGTLND